MNAISLTKLSRDVTVAFHNLRRYDGHLIMQKLGLLCSESNHLDLEVVAKNMEDYLSFSIKVFSEKRKHDGTAFKSYYTIRFIDSFQFLTNSLESLVSTLKPEDFKGNV